MIQLTHSSRSEGYIYKECLSSSSILPSICRQESCQLYIFCWASVFTEVINSSPPGQNGRHFADNILRCIFLNENNIPIGISLKLVPRGPINNKSALIQVMAWRRTGDKPLPEPVMTQFTDVYMHH